MPDSNEILQTINNYNNELIFLSESTTMVLEDIDLLFERFIPMLSDFSNELSEAEKVFNIDSKFKLYQYYKGSYKQIHNTYATNLNFYLFPEPINQTSDIDPYWKSFDPSNVDNIAYKTSNIQDYYDEFGKDRTTTELFEPLVKLIIDTVTRNKSYFIDNNYIVPVKYNELISFLLKSDWVYRRYPTINFINVTDIISNLILLVKVKNDRVLISSNEIEQNNTLTSYFNSIVYKNNLKSNFDPTITSNAEQKISPIEDNNKTVRSIGIEYYTRVKQLQVLYESIVQNMNGIIAQTRTYIKSLTLLELTQFVSIMAKFPNILNSLVNYNIIGDKYNNILRIDADPYYRIDTIGVDSRAVILTNSLYQQTKGTGSTGTIDIIPAFGVWSRKYYYVNYACVSYDREELGGSYYRGLIFPESNRIYHNWTHLSVRYTFNYFPEFRSNTNEDFDSYARNYFKVNDIDVTSQLNTQLTVLNDTISKYVPGTPYSIVTSDNVTGPHYQYYGSRNGVVSNRSDGTFPPQ